MEAPDQEGARQALVGILRRNTGSTLECLEELRTSADQPKDALDAIQRAVKRLRPRYLRLFTFKSVAAFDIYECHPQVGYHSPVETSEATVVALQELYYDFSGGRRDHDDVWKKWIHRNFNRGDSYPGSKRLALRLVLHWSTRKILLFTFAPILLSLAVGFWYMFKARDPGTDMATAVQTAWSISSYIATTAGVTTAVLAAVTSLGDN